MEADVDASHEAIASLSVLAFVASPTAVLVDATKPGS